MSSNCYLTDFINRYFCQTSYVKVSAVSCRLLSWCKMPGFIWYLVLVWVPQNIACCQHDWRPCASLAWVCVWSGWRCTVIILLSGEQPCVFEREREREVVLLWGTQAFFPFLRARLFEWISSFTKESSDEHFMPYSKGTPLQSTQWVTNTHM